MRDVPAQGFVVRAPHEIDVATAPELAVRLAEALAAHGDVVLDCSGLRRRDAPLPCYSSTPSVAGLACSGMGRQMVQSPRPWHLRQGASASRPTMSPRPLHTQHRAEPRHPAHAVASSTSCELVFTC
jgi:hypothetical protein